MATRLLMAISRERRQLRSARRAAANARKHSAFGLEAEKCSAPYFCAQAWR